jgi:hypothetical protein
MDWVLAAERAYVAAAIRAGETAGEGRPRADPAGPPRTVTRAVQDRAVAAAGAIASRHLAVGSPRSFGLLIDIASEVEGAALALAAHRTWFDPRDIRCAATHSGADALVAATGGRRVSLDEALACDIVHVHGAYVRVTPKALRRGTHVNVVWEGVLDPELHQLATVRREAQLPALAAGLIDGRQLDEITVFVIDGAPIAAAAAAV